MGNQTKQIRNRPKKMKLRPTSISCISFTTIYIISEYFESHFGLVPGEKKIRTHTQLSSQKNNRKRFCAVHLLTSTELLRALRKTESLYNMEIVMENATRRQFNKDRHSLFFFFFAGMLSDKRCNLRDISQS